VIENPAARRSRPTPTAQRTSSPVKGRVLAFSFVGVAEELVLGAVSLLGVVFSPVFSSFEGEVPVVGVVFGVVVDGVEGVVLGVGAVWL
jgi:hypothetical protein